MRVLYGRTEVAVPTVRAEVDKSWGDERVWIPATIVASSTDASRWSGKGEGKWEEQTTLDAARAGQNCWEVSEWRQRVGTARPGDESLDPVARQMTQLPCALP